MSNYTIKNDLNGATGVDTSSVAAKSYLVRLKSGIDEIDSHKLETVPVDQSMLSNIVINEVVKKTVYDKLVAKVNAIDISGSFFKNQVWYG